MPWRVVDLDRLPVDPRIIDEIQRSSSAYSEQGVGFMDRWGGPEKYKEMSSLDTSERKVYSAVLDGFVTYGDIGEYTGLSQGEIVDTIKGLQSKGLVSKVA